jgi:response regulator RpfG family c-di-GMP phosphodiesterase
MASPTPASILIVDDDDMVRSAIARYLQRTGFEPVQANSGEQALERLAERRFDAMLCDIRMPGMSGIELLPQAIAKDPDIAVLMLTAVGDPSSAISCLRVGAVDYLVKPVELEELQHALQYALRKRELEIERREMERWLAREVAEKTRALEEQSRQVESLSLSILTVLVDVAEPKAVGERNHSMRVSGLAAHVAAQLGLQAEEIENIRMAGRLHDLGRIVSKDERMRRVSDPGGFGGTAAEAAARILEPLRQHAAVVDAVKSQFEHWDGSGSPAHAKGDVIPIGGRIIAVVNKFDELTDGAGDGAAAVPDAALKKVREWSGSAFDPAVVSALEAVVARRG